MARRRNKDRIMILKEDGYEGIGQAIRAKKWHKKGHGNIERKLEIGSGARRTSMSNDAVVKL